MFGLIKAGWRARRNLRIYQGWVKFYEDCPIPPGVTCEECERYSHEVGTVEQCRSWVNYYKAVLS